MHILITGATGFIGKTLSKKLLAEGHQLTILTRDKNSVPDFLKNSNIRIFEWADTSILPPPESILGINGVINLIGENIAAKRWSNEQKKVLYDSRITATKNLTSLINQNSITPLDFFISASAIGIYPINHNEALNEDSELGEGFLADLCKSWEAAASTILETERIVIIRTAVVLESSGGAFKKMLPPFKLGLGGPIGDGSQIMSWIHSEDLVNIYINAATNKHFKGIYNACAPFPVNNRHFTKVLGKVLHRPTIFPVPALFLKILFGEMSSIILDSQKIISKRLSDENFKFKYESIELALKNLLS
jgi:uncharacterized protein (TIGR01777 family)